MTTPRIEERGDNGVRKPHRIKVGDEWFVPETIAQQAHQAGIDEAVKKMEDLFADKAKYNEDFVDNGYGEPINTSYWTIYEGDWEKIIKAPQDNK